MTRAEKLQWEQVRAQGEGRYVLREGIVRYGLLPAVVFMVVSVLFNILDHHQIEITWSMISEAGIGVLLSGGWVAVEKWRKNEREFLEPAQDDVSVARTVR